jgi:hypothetical protein
MAEYIDSNIEIHVQLNECHDAYRRLSNVALMSMDRGEICVVTELIRYIK